MIGIIFYHILIDMKHGDSGECRADCATSADSVSSEITGRHRLVVACRMH